MLLLPSRCKLVAGGVCAFNACSGDCDASVVFTGDTVAELAKPVAAKLTVFLV